MKKALVLFAVLALTMAMASVALAEVTIDGSIEFLMRSVKNTTDWNDATTTAGDYHTTYERVRLGVNAKHEGVSGRVQIENDWDQWGATASATNPNPGFETGRTSKPMYIREGWINFNIPFGVPGFVKVGRQFLQLGNGWFFRSNKYGSDAWVIGFPGQNTVAFVNVKASENDSTMADDTDAYVLLDTFKIDEKNSVGAYIVNIKDRKAAWTNRFFAIVDPAGAPYNFSETTLQDIGLHYNGMVGPVKLAAEIDMQSGKIKAPGSTDIKFKGTEVVLQAGMSMDALSVRATAAQGSGSKAGDTDFKAFLPFLDKDPHYTLVYEYFMETACGFKNSGFCNTTALSVGADFKVTDMITVGADLWMLKATEKVDASNGPTDDLGNEIDVKVNLKLADQLTWNTTYGLFMSGKAYDPAVGVSADDASALQSVLSYKF